MKIQKNILLELRKNPELNIKTDPVKEIEQYSKDPDVYISYRSIDKIGINPKSKYNTPNGIYTYPLKEIFPALQQGGISNVPFAGDENYVYVIKLKPNYKKHFVNNMYLYDSSNYDVDIQKLKTHFIPKHLTEKEFDDIKNKGLSDAKNKNPITSMWNITRVLANYKPNNWNFILRKVLGYCGFADKSGRGIIHESEPIQAVFLDPTCFTVLSRIQKNYTNIKKDFDYYINNTNFDELVKNKKFLKYNINKQTKGGNTLLHLAINNHLTDDAKMLIDNGAEVNIKNKSGITPLQMAVQNNNIDIIEYLVPKKIKPDFKIIRYGIEHEQISPEIIKYLINNFDNINIKDERDNTLLYYSIFNNDFIISKFLLDKGADPLIKNNDKFLLMDAIEEGYNISFNTIKILINYIPDINIIHEHKNTPLMSAISHKKEMDIIKYLISKGADLNKQNIWGKTALIIAIEENYYNVVKYLVLIGADVNIKDKKGYTALSYAEEIGDGIVVDFLKDHGAKTSNELTESFITFKKFLKESFDNSKLQKAILLFNKSEKIDSTAYYLKKGASVLAEAIYVLTDKIGKIWLLSDDDSVGIYYCVEIDGKFYDVNGLSENKNSKLEFVSVIGIPKWKIISEQELQQKNKSRNEVLALVKKLQKFYKNIDDK
jgi:ankyrin repeat protein